MNRVVLLSLLGLSLTGCVTTISLPREDRTRVYQDDFDTVFKATAHALHEEGYALFDIDYLGGVIETDELFNAGREEFSRVVASVSEWDDGTHLLLIYYMEDIYLSVEEAIYECGTSSIVRHALPPTPSGSRPEEWCGTSALLEHAHPVPSQRRPSRIGFTCSDTVVYQETYRMPQLARSKARKYYNDLFSKIEAAM